MEKNTEVEKEFSKKPCTASDIIITHFRRKTPVVIENDNNADNDNDTYGDDDDDEDLYIPSTQQVKPDYPVMDQGFESAKAVFINDFYQKGKSLENGFDKMVKKMDYYIKETLDEEAKYEMKRVKRVFEGKLESISKKLKIYENFLESLE